jgi:hypothetical protein
MRGLVLDNFEDLSGWTAITSGESKLSITQDDGPHGKAMRLDFDFCGGGGFVVARKLLPLELPESYSFSFQIRGDAPSNIFEFKLMDPSDRNVWRYRVESFDFPAEWRQMCISNNQIEFAWGPLGGGPATTVTAMELVIAAGPGGKGTVWIDGLYYSDDTYRLTPKVEASSALTGHEPGHALNLTTDASWRSREDDDSPWFRIDFLQEREYGGMVIQWEEGFAPGQFNAEISPDGSAWETVYIAHQAARDRNYLYLPRTRSRYLRLTLLRGFESEGVGIKAIDVKPFDFSRSINHFFQAVARDEQAGLYPKYLLNRQTYWTPVGSGMGDGQALFNEEGMVEVDAGAFSIAPFLYWNDRLITWADGTLQQKLENHYLPIPSSQWQTGCLVMNITACVTEEPGKPVLIIRYSVENGGNGRQSVILFTALLPFQVTPTWQNWRSFGGVSRIHDISFKDGTVRVNGNRAVISLNPASGFGAAAFDQGTVGKHLSAGDVPSQHRIHDDFGYASGALRFDLEIAAGFSQEVYLAVPMGPVEAADDPSLLSAVQSLNPPELLTGAIGNWEKSLCTVEITLPPEAKSISHTLKTTAAHILINRDGPALHPGPRRYARSWIRDGVIMGAALLRLGCTDALRDFIRWYAAYQSADGVLPDCADRDGTEWLPEFDAYGQLIFAVMEYYRFTGDRSFLQEMRPAVLKTVAYLERLRSSRLTAEYRTADKRGCFGLLPESMSHEGYMAHPVHAYWDDFWAIRGLADAARLEQEMGNAEEALRLTTLRDSLSEDVRASLSATIARHKIDFVPGSVEFGDFDPTATSNAIGLLDLLHLLPPAETENTFDKYLTGFRERAGGTLEWNNYTAYEIRIIGALVRLGRRHDALELAAFMLADRRIPPWNQWPEISWRDQGSPSFIGDLPHTWISAEYILSVCSMFAYEREADRSLVAAAGLSPEWIREGFEAGIEGLATYYGKISYKLRLENSDTLRFNLQEGIIVPGGGIVVKPPLPLPIREVEVNGRPTESFTDESFTLFECPAEVVVRL